jgi:hypothetical protein
VRNTQKFLDCTTQHREFDITPNQTGSNPKHLAQLSFRAQAHHLKYVDGLGPSLDNRRPKGHHLDIGFNQSVSRLADEHSSGLGDVFQARCQHNPNAHRCVFKNAAHPNRTDDHVIGVHAHTHGKFRHITFLTKSLCDTASGCVYPQRSSDSPQRVILVCLWRAKEGLETVSLQARQITSTLKDRRQDGLEGLIHKI